MKIELYFYWRDKFYSKVVDIPFLPRNGDSMIIGDQSDTTVTEVCFDLTDDTVAISLDGDHFDREEVDWLINNDGWICE